MSPRTRKPRDDGRRASGAISGLRALYGNTEATCRRKGWQSPSLPRNWRDRLPDPATYYGARVDKLGKANVEGWAQGRCPFHEDRHESLSVHLTHPAGGWKCFSGCGKGDMVSFHQRLTGLGFADAVRDLVGVGR